LIIIPFAILLILISNIIKKDIRNIKTKLKIQNGKILYSDLNKPSKTLFSKHYKISGKPDYIIRRNNHYIPVELKTGKHYYPKKNHIMQLAAYCQILEEYYQDFVPYGILVYNDSYQQHNIQYDPKLRFELESVVKKMNNMLRTKKVYRNHNDSNKCKNCSMRSYCNNQIE
jgi:CRISPR-associated exonuclease Cas4